MKKVKLYGERNSGTNYLELLLDKNLEIEVLKIRPPKSPLVAKMLSYDPALALFFHLQRKTFLGWKHGMPKINEINNFKEDLTVITITKNPYAFLLSLYQRPYNSKIKPEHTFKAFLNSQWPLSRMDSSEKRILKSPIELWNMKNRGYTQLAEQTNKPLINLRYEDLLKDPLKATINLAKSLGVERICPFTNIVQSTKNSVRQLSDYQDYYLREHWREILKKEEIKIINEQLDTDLLDTFSYEILT